MDSSTESEKKFKCEQCPECFNRNFSLMLHRTVVHNAVKKLECSQSGKVYELENVVTNPKGNCKEITVIKDTSNNLKETQCEECKKFFGNKNTLEKHISTVHDKERNFECGQCSKTFGQSSNLSRHIAIVHDGRRNYICDICRSTLWIFILT